MITVKGFPGIVCNKPGRETQYHAGTLVLNKKTSRGVGGFFNYNFSVAGGSLLDVIKHKMRVTNCKHGVFDEATIATVLKEVLKGLEYFHSNGQIHRWASN